MPIGLGLKLKHVFVSSPNLFELLYAIFTISQKKIIFVRFHFVIYCILYDFYVQVKLLKLKTMGQNRVGYWKSASWDTPKWVKSNSWIREKEREKRRAKVCVNNGQHRWRTQTSWTRVSPGSHKRTPTVKNIDFFYMFLIVWSKYWGP